MNRPYTSNLDNFSRSEFHNSESGSTIYFEAGIFYCGACQIRFSQNKYGMLIVSSRQSPLLDHRIIGAYCNLISLKSIHTQYIIKWRNDPNIAKWFNSAASFDQVSHERWLADAQASRRDFNFVIERVENCPAGMVALYNIDWEGRSAEFGRLLIGDPAARRAGLAREAAVLLLGAAAKAGIEQVHLEVKEDNTAAITLYSSLGFRHLVPSARRSGLIEMSLRIGNES